MKSTAIVFGGLLIAATSFAAIPKKAAQTPAQKPIMTSAQILKAGTSTRGGQSGTAFWVKDVRRTVSKNGKIERLVFDFGNASGDLQKGQPPYYTVAVSQNKQVVMDFSQTLNSKLEPRDLEKLVKASSLLKGSKLLFDRQSQTMSFVFDFKKDTLVRVQPVNGSKNRTAKLIVDFKQTTK